MPITPGPQVMEMIRSEPESAQVPIIFLTGNSDRQSVMKVMAMKPQGYLLKTMDKYQIMDSIDTFFETQKWKMLRYEELIQKNGIAIDCGAVIMLV